MKNAQTRTTAPRPELYAMPPIAGSERLPHAVTEAQRAWERAEKDAAAGRWLVAATTFLNVAEQLRLPAESFYGELVVDPRGYAYQNAAICFAAAGAVPLARRRLDEALAADPAARPAIEEAIASLPR